MGKHQGRVLLVVVTALRKAGCARDRGLLKSLGFEPYVSVGQSSLEGLRENIFRQIINSEYFLFVDFKREQIVRNDSSGSMVLPIPRLCSPIENWPSLLF